MDVEHWKKVINFLIPLVSFYVPPPWKHQKTREVSWSFQGEYRKTSGMKWIKKNVTFSSLISLAVEYLLKVNKKDTRTNFITCSLENVIFCAIWYHLYNLKNVKNIHARVLLLVKLQALYKWYQIAQCITINLRISYYNFPRLLHRCSLL